MSIAVFLSERTSLMRKSYSSTRVTHLHTRNLQNASSCSGMPSRKDIRIVTLFTARAVYLTAKLFSPILTGCGVVGHPCRLDASTRSPGSLFPDIPRPPLSKFLLTWCHLSFSPPFAEILAYVLIAIVSNLYCYNGIQ